MSKNVFIYARRSSQKKKEDTISIEQQIELIENKCNKLGFEIINIYKDNESSFKEGKRDEFLKMINEINKRNLKGKGDYINYIYVYEISRLARNRKEANQILDLIENEDIQILSINETYDDTIGTLKKIMDDFTSATYDSKLKSQRGKLSMDKTQKDKGKISRRPLFGYKMTFDEFGNKKMVINYDNNEEELVKKVFNMYSTGTYTYKSIAEKLNQEGFTKKIINKAKKNLIYRDFTEKDTRNILINPFYYGKVEINYKELKRTEIEYFKSNYPNETINKQFIVDYTKFINECGDFKAIIKKEIFDKCLEVREGKKGKIKKIEDPTKGAIYIFRTLLRCPCKKDIEDNVSNYFRYTQEEKINKKYLTKTNYYKCCGGNPKCHNKSMSELKLLDEIEKEFIDGITFSDLEIKIFEEIVYSELKSLGEIKENSTKLLIQKLSNLRKDEKNYYDAYVKEDFEKLKNEHKKNWIKTTNQIEEIENKINNMNSVVESKEKYIKDYIYYINNLGTNFNSFPKARKMKFIQSFFEYIVVDKIKGGNIEIIEYKLNPVFELAYNKKKVLCNTKKNKNFNSNKSNLIDSLSKSKTSNLSVSVLNGSPTRNRT